MLCRQKANELLDQAREAGVKLNPDALTQPDLPPQPVAEPAPETSSR
jgi:hypothetical protein